VRCGRHGFPGGVPSRGAAGDNISYLIKRVVADEGQRVPAEFAHAVSASSVSPLKLIVKGDGERSLDSRQLGEISAQDVVAVAAFALKPFRNLTRVPFQG
jgi:type IV secretory pathway protease TraF